MLWIHFNKLEGEIPTLPLFNTQYSIHNNLLIGSIPALPQGLALFNCHGNLLSGEMPQIPRSLKILKLGTPEYTSNKISGSIVLDTPTIVLINNNLISKIVIYNTSLLAVDQCDLSYNPLNTDLAANLTMCAMTMASKVEETQVFTTLPTLVSSSTIKGLKTRVFRTTTHISYLSISNISNSTSIAPTTVFKTVEQPKELFTSTMSIENNESWFIPTRGASLVEWSVSGVALLLYFVIGIVLISYTCKKLYKKSPDDESILTVLSFKKRIKRKESIS